MIQMILAAEEQFFFKLIALPPSHCFHFHCERCILVLYEHLQKTQIQRNARKITPISCLHFKCCFSHLKTFTKPSPPTQEIGFFNLSEAKTPQELCTWVSYGFHAAHAFPVSPQGLFPVVIRDLVTKVHVHAQSCQQTENQRMDCNRN